MLTAVLSFGATGAVAAYTHFQGNVNVADVSSLVGPPPSSTATNVADPNAGRALNILVMGSDQRNGEDGAIGGYVGGMRSDTTMVAHVSADRSRVDVVSIPRDSLVDIPSCTATNGKTSRATRDMFNSAFATGADLGGDTASAAACTIKTVQQDTGLTIDHWVVVDFAGFIRMVDAIGGVPICIPNAMDAPKAGLQVAAGYQTLDGTTALAYARARTGQGVGDGSDTNRIGRQQQLIAATMRELLSKNMLTNVPQLMGFLDGATQALTVDKGLGALSDMAGLGYSLRGISSGNITFMTIPFGAAPTDPNRVVWTSDAHRIWQNMLNDVPLTDGAAGAATPSTTATAPSAGSTAAAVPSTAATGSAVPTPQATKQAGKEAFTADDVTAVCG